MRYWKQIRQTAKKKKLIESYNVKLNRDLQCTDYFGAVPINFVLKN